MLAAGMSARASALTRRGVRCRLSWPSNARDDRGHRLEFRRVEMAFAECASRRAPGRCGRGRRPVAAPGGLGVRDLSHRQSRCR